MRATASKSRGLSFIVEAGMAPRIVPSGAGLWKGGNSRGAEGIAGLCKTHPLFEKIGDRRAYWIWIDRAHDVEALTQGCDGPRMGAMNGVTGQKMLGNDDDGRPLGQRFGQFGRHLDATDFETGAAHLLHQIGLYSVFFRRDCVTAMHVNFGQPRQRESSELERGEPTRNPFQQ